MTNRARLLPLFGSRAPYQSNSYLVGYDEGAIVQVERFIQTRFQQISHHRECRLFECSLPSGLDDRVLETIRQYPGVRFVEPNLEVRPVLPPARTPRPPGGEPVIPPGTAGCFPNDPDIGRLWGLHSIRALQSCPAVPTEPIVVAVIDDGVDYLHEDLYLNIWINQGEIPPSVRLWLADVDGDGVIGFRDLNHPLNQGPGKVADSNGNGYVDGGDLLAPTGWADGFDNDANGYTDDLIGRDFKDNDSDPMCGIDDDHGTHVAGTIAATANNDAGVAGVAPDARIMVIRFPMTCPNMSQTLNAIRYARLNGAHIINASWHACDSTGRSKSSQVLANELTELEQANLLFVCAAGNNAHDNDRIPNFPATFQHSNIISVAAIDPREQLFGASNYGRYSVDLAAPGSEVYSTVPPIRSRDTRELSIYMASDGTSMAAPHVAGAAARVWSHPCYQHFSAIDVKNLILKNTRPLPALYGKCVTGGTLDLSFLEHCPLCVPRVNAGYRKSGIFDAQQTVHMPIVSPTSACPHKSMRILTQYVPEITELVVWERIPVVPLPYAVNAFPIDRGLVPGRHVAISTALRPHRIRHLSYRPVFAEVACTCEVEATNAASTIPILPHGIAVPQTSAPATVVPAP